MYNVFDLMHAYFVKVILSAPRERWRQQIQRKMLT